MVSYLIIGLGSLFLYWFCKKALSLNRNIAIAKAAGIPYRVSCKDPSFYQNQSNSKTGLDSD